MIHAHGGDDKMSATDSILQTIKQCIGIDNSYNAFDNDIIMHINSVFMILNQLGAGPKSGYTISDDSNTWVEFSENNLLVNIVKTYMALKVRMLFDPPTSGTLSDCIERQISECEWRILQECEASSNETE
jgi:hypothetical protein